MSLTAVLPAVLPVLVAANDPRSTRIVYAMVLGLLAVGVAFVMLGVWLLRQTRSDLDLLAPLERMGDREWRRQDPVTQRRELDARRPDGAAPLRTQKAPPIVDDAFDLKPESRPVEELRAGAGDAPDAQTDDPAADPAAEPDAAPEDAVPEDAAPEDAAPENLADPVTDPSSR